METAKQNKSITVSTTVNAPIEKVWKYWNEPKHIKKWYHASDDWHVPHATNDLHVGGKFLTRMESMDGKMGFDFEGVYESVETNRLIEYVLADERRVKIEFTTDNNTTTVTETFDLENENTEEMQRGGWQAILDNFKKNTESEGNKKEKLIFNISINAPVKEVYTKMIDESSYKEWTKIFNKDSHFIGNWQKGTKMLFVGTDDNGNTGGMVSFVEENIPNKYISVEHRGVLSGDEEIMEGPEVDSWAGVFERYKFEDKNGSTLITIELDSNEDFKNYFTDTFPKALQLLKSICEKN